MIPIHSTPVDWETLRALGHRMVDDAMECLQTVSVRLEHPDDLIADLLQALEG